MRHALRVTAAMLLAGLAAGCATPEYYREQQTCLQEWAVRIPPDYRQVAVSRERSIRVPDGTETCTKTGAGSNASTRCEKGMRTEWIPYVAVETVDANALLRDQRVRECAAARCARIYGNAGCKA